VVRDERGGWLPASSPQSLREQVHDNLRRLGLDVLDVVNLRTLTGIDDRATVPDTLTPPARRRRSRAGRDLSSGRSSQPTSRGFKSHPATRKNQVKGLIAGNRRRVFHHPVPAPTPGS
jgi:hypothetical protein